MKTVPNVDFAKSVLIVSHEHDLDYLLWHYNYPKYIGIREINEFPLQFMMDDTETYRLRGIDAKGKRRIEF